MISGFQCNAAIDLWSLEHEQALNNMLTFEFILGWY